jgi:hypothetical protein
LGDFICALYAIDPINVLSVLTKKKYPDKLNNKKGNIMKYIMILIASFSIPLYGIVSPQRFIKKIDKHIQYLYSVYKQTKTLKDNYVQRTYSLHNRFTYDDIYSFKHPKIKSCIKKINYLKSIQPFFSLWDYIYYNQDIALEKDALLLREYSVLLIFFYNKLLVTVHAYHKAQVDGQKLTLDDLIGIYALLKQMPLQKMMNAVDAILEKFAVALEDEQIGKSILAWLVRYWWMPPAIASAIIISILRTDSLLTGADT